MLPNHHNTSAVEEESSCHCVECEVPRKLLLHRDQLMPPLKIGFERSKENILIVQQFHNRRRRSRNGTPEE